MEIVSRGNSTDDGAGRYISLLAKYAAQSSPSFPYPSTPPGSSCSARNAVGDGCNPSVTFRSCSWHLRLTRTDSRFQLLIAQLEVEGFLVVVLYRLLRKMA